MHILLLFLLGLMQESTAEQPQRTAGKCYFAQSSGRSATILQRKLPFTLHPGSLFFFFPGVLTLQDTSIRFVMLTRIMWLSMFYKGSILPHFFQLNVSSSLLETHLLGYTASILPVRCKG